MVLFIFISIFSAYLVNAYAQPSLFHYNKIFLSPSIQPTNSQASRSYNFAYQTSEDLPMKNHQLTLSEDKAQQEILGYVQPVIVHRSVKYSTDNDFKPAEHSAQPGMTSGNSLNVIYNIQSTSSNDKPSYFRKFRMI